MKKFLLSLLASTTPILAHSITLDEAISYSLANNPQILAIREGNKQEIEKISEAKSGWFPTIAASYDMNWDNYDPKSGDNLSANSQVASISANQPIFTGFQTTAEINAAKANADASDNLLIDAELSLVKDIADAYMSVISSEAISGLSGNNVEVLQKQFEATQEQVNFGEKTNTDLSQAQARLANAKTELIEANGNLATAKADFIRLVGKEPENLQDISQFPNLPQSLEGLLQIVKENNRQIISADSAIIAAEAGKDAALSVLLPKVSLNAEISDNRDIGLGEPEDFVDSRVGLNFTVPLYQSGAEYSRLKQAKTEYSKQIILRNEQYNQIISMATSAWAELETAKSSLKSNDEAIKAAELALQGVKKEAEFGVRSTLDVLDAEQELFRAKVNLEKAKAREVASIYNLLYLIGDKTFLAKNEVELKKEVE